MKPYEQQNRKWNALCYSTDLILAIVLNGLLCLDYKVGFGLFSNTLSK
jgi:hypothetical protein